MSAALKPVAWIAALAVLLVLAVASVAVVPETRQGVLVRLGDPVAVINRDGRGAGPLLRIPFADQLLLFDRRPLPLDLPKQEVVAVDGSRYAADAFARVQVVDPLAVARTGGDEQRAKDALAPAIEAALSEAVSHRPPAALLGAGEGAMLADARAAAEPAARRLGFTIREIDIERVALPAGPVLDQAIERMRGARRQQASQIVSDGRRDAEATKQAGDEAAAAIYQGSYGRDPRFYAFYRSLKSYRQSLTSGTVVLGPDSAYLQAFRGR